jgi:hypothetical protein
VLTGRGLTIALAPLERMDTVPRGDCLFAEAGGALPAAGSDCRPVPTHPLAEGFVMCSPRATVLIVGLDRGAAAADARLADGTTRRLAIRRTPTGRRIALLVTGEGIRALVARSRAGRVAQRHRVNVPPAGRQCGFGFWSFDSTEP